jgi:hypothetical protein
MDESGGDEFVWEDLAEMGCAVATKNPSGW